MSPFDEYRDYTGSITKSQIKHYNPLNITENYMSRNYAAPCMWLAHKKMNIATFETHKKRVSPLGPVFAVR